MQGSNDSFGSGYNDCHFVNPTEPSGSGKINSIFQLSKEPTGSDLVAVSELLPCPKNPLGRTGSPSLNELFGLGQQNTLSSVWIVVRSAERCGASDCICESSAGFRGGFSWVDVIVLSAFVAA